MTASSEIKVFGPATVSNVGPGFDLLGFALENPGDKLLVRKNDKGIIRLFNETDSPLPTDPKKNVAAVAANSLLKELDCKDGFDLVFQEKINPGSGVGSSAASCVAAVVGINEILGKPFAKEALIPYAMDGEKVASGATHADNVAPALLGGITLIRGYDPLDIKHIPYPDDLWCAVVHPRIEIKTMESRKLVPDTVPLETALKQCGNLAGLVSGLATSDYSLISRSVTDLFAEPYRIKQIPDFHALKEAVLKNGSIGAGLSGSGPSVFALCRGEESALTLGKIMKSHFADQGIESMIYTSAINNTGCKVL